MNQAIEGEGEWDGDQDQCSDLDENRGFPPFLGYVAPC